MVAVAAQPAAVAAVVASRAVVRGVAAERAATLVRAKATAEEEGARG